MKISIYTRDSSNSGWMRMDLPFDRMLVSEGDPGHYFLVKYEQRKVSRIAFDAEAIACHEAVLTGLEIGYSKVVIEGDSKTIINKWATHVEDRSEVSAHIRNIHREISKFQTISFHYAPRSVNQLAHLIATTSLKKMEVVYLIGEVPCYAKKQWEMDRPQEPD
ncbi:hypothetical protein J1N35_003969 [Gossypium stocksii]|uniref:RNase H type-1 domain-containing protein n=1 Tax=Gossypium stocksii TaxID=47602 RepID=A0A9D3WA75_9ROSI|nr:hypothetical protein J1N35_003969 [Gossypium stocksii]